MTHRSMLGWGLLSLTAGLVVRTFAGSILGAYSDYLGHPVSLQITFVTVLLDAVVVIGIPLGCALVAGSFVVKALAPSRRSSSSDDSRPLE